MDSDDWIEEHYVEKLIGALLENEADAAICDYYIANNGNITPVSHIGPCSGEPTEKIQRKIIINGTQIWSAIFKRSLFIDNKLLFPEKLSYEDNAVCTPIFLCAKKITKINDKLYFYRTDNISTTRSLNNSSFFDRLITAKMFLENTVRLGYYEHFRKEIDEAFLNLYFRNTLFGLFQKFKPIPFAKIRTVTDNTIEMYGYKSICKYISGKRLYDRIIMYGALVSPRFGFSAYKVCDFISKIKHAKLR